MVIDRDNLLFALRALIEKCEGNPEIHLSALYTLDNILAEMRRDVARAIVKGGKAVIHNNSNMAAGREGSGDALGAELG